MNEPTITVKVNTKELTKQLNNLDLTKLSPTDLENLIKEKIEVLLIGNETEKRFYVRWRGRDD
mgnify:CR=1 FL=1